MIPLLRKLSSKSQITIPRKWIRDNNLKIGDKLGLFVRKRGRTSEICIMALDYFKDDKSLMKLRSGELTFN